MSYPFFQCVSCNVPVQKAIEYKLGSIPFGIHQYRDVPLSGIFETSDSLSFCRGQGMRYSDPDHLHVTEFVEGYHFNFSAIFKGYCCFCALHAGFGSELFLDSACHGCRKRDLVSALFVELMRSSNTGMTTSWRTHRWAALPSVILDKIVRYLVGDGLAVHDGRIVPSVPSVEFE